MEFNTFIIEKEGGGFVSFDTALPVETVQKLFSDMSEAEGYTFEDKMASIPDVKISRKKIIKIKKQGV